MVVVLFRLDAINDFLDDQVLSSTWEMACCEIMSRVVKGDSRREERAILLGV